MDAKQPFLSRLFRQTTSNTSQPTTTIAEPSSGALAESVAKHYLLLCGLQFVENNYLCKSGEIDLIMRDQAQLVFVEVRYRKQNKFGSPLETVTYSKQQKLIRAANHYLLENSIYRDDECRFDVISICGKIPDKKTLKMNSSNSNITWIKHAFSVQ